MIIDIHTHIFPKELAAKAIGALSESVGRLYKPVHDGTAEGLLKNMDRWGIDISVVQPVLTKQSQFVKLNEWAASLCSDRLISFGGVFPHTDDYKRDIDYVASLGLKGIKFHAEYQHFAVDDMKMLKIYDYALGKGLILLHHAGFDIAFSPPFKSSPKMFANVADAMKGGVIIAAHLGGSGQLGDVEALLAGKPIYLDTSMGFDYYSDEQFLRIVEKHGAERIMFASDAPWSSADAEMSRIRALPLSENEKDAILAGNAKRILGLEPAIQ